MVYILENSNNQVLWSMDRVNTWLVVMMMMVTVEMTKMIQNRLIRSRDWAREHMYL